MALFGRKKKTEVETPVEEPLRLPEGPPVDDRGLRSLDDHRNYLLGLVEELPPFGMQLLDAQGLAICEDIKAYGDLPRTALATIAGYAVRADDVAGSSQDEPVQLTVTGADDLGEQTAARVAPSQRLPEGADAVLPMEFTDRGEESVRVSEPVAPGENLRAQGSDVSDGQVLIREGQVLDDRSSGLLAALGIDKVLARPRPRVVVISAGEALVEPGRRLTDAQQVHDANAYMIAAAAKAEGCQVWRVGVVGNDRDEIRDTISDQLIRADLIISTGGVSEADGELIREVMPELGLTDFADVAMHPGRRQGFGLIGEDRVPMVMLPAHPLSAYLSYHAFVRPVIRKLMGVHPHITAPVRAFGTTVLRSPAGFTSLLPARVERDSGRNVVLVDADAENRQLSALAECNGVAVLGPDVEMVRAGEPVQCWLFDQPA